MYVCACTILLIYLSLFIVLQITINFVIVIVCIIQTLAVFEGLHQDQILCAAAVNSNVIVTAGESTVVCVWELKKESKDKGKLSMQLTKVGLKTHCKTMSKRWT